MKDGDHDQSAPSHGVFVRFVPSVSLLLDGDFGYNDRFLARMSPAPTLEAHNDPFSAACEGMLARAVQAADAEFMGQPRARGLAAALCTRWLKPPSPAQGRRSLLFVQEPNGGWRRLAPRSLNETENRS